MVYSQGIARNRFYSEAKRVFNKVDHYDRYISIQSFYKYLFALVIDHFIRSLFDHFIRSDHSNCQNKPPKDIENDFRQISVLPQLSKVLEKIQLQLNSQDLKFKDNQHAFLSDRSTVSALISTSQKWFDATDNSKLGRKGTHAIFLDFRKAFDLVDHVILLYKLASMNVTKSFWLWTQNFLSGRSQQVKLREM